MSGTLQESLYDVARRSPGKRAIGFYSASGDLSWLTYEELHGLGFGAAGWLREQGVRRGDACVLALGDARRSAGLWLGVLALGAIPLMIAPPGIQRSTRSQGEILRAIARRTRARLVVTDEPFEDTGGLDARLRDVSDRADAPQGKAIDPVIPSSRAVVAYQLTSGTTGLPRVCVWGQRAVVATLEATRAALALRRDEVFVNWTPLYHDLGLFNNFLLCLSSGIPLVVLSPMDFVRSPAVWLRALSDTRATQTWSANFGFALAVERVRDEELSGVRLDSVRGFWNAAERVHVETFTSFHERFSGLGVRLRALKTSYGCAENVGGATFGDPAGDFVFERVRAEPLYDRGIAEPVADAASGGVSIVSAGRPCPGVKVVILRRGRRLPDGHVGEVALVTSSRMQGYLRDAASTRRVLRDRYLMTGDLGYRRGHELFWTGRVRERINVRGRKLDPSDFEPVLLAVEGLRRGCFVAFGVDDAARGTQKVVIVAELRDAGGDAEAVGRAVRAASLRQLGVALDDVVLVPRGSLTKTTSGKRRHRAYQQQYLDGTLEALRVG